MRRRRSEDGEEEVVILLGSYLCYLIKLLDLYVSEVGIKLFINEENMVFPIKV